MALPHLPTSYTTRKNIYEAAIVRRRNHDSNFREQWDNTARYFQQANVEMNQKEAWESDKSFHNSMDAWRAEQDKDKKAINLKRRRAKLAEMLNRERAQFQAELSGLSGDNYARIEDMKDRSEGLKSAREEERKRIAEEKLYEHWRSNNPDIRRLELGQHKNHVIKSWGGQLEERRQREEEEQRIKEEMDRRLEEERLLGLELERQKAQEKLDDEKQLKAILKEQVVELRAGEEEAKRLKRQQDMLMREESELQKLEEQRKKVDAERKKTEHGRILLRQHQAALRRKSKQIQEELEQDMMFLEELVQQERQDQAIQTSRREKAKADAAWMKNVIQDQIKLEKEREAELDLLYQDEAARMWQKRETEWDRERQARQRLIREVMEERQQQIQRKMEVVRHQQQESLQRREELVREMEVANQMTRREMEEKEEVKAQRKEELVAQIDEMRERENQSRLEMRLELEDEREAEQNYDEMLRQEASRLSMRDYEPRAYPIKKQAWM